ncbi:unnamed protein product [Cylicostephanus goldi]|uniref:Pseudouridine synthase RsuA/RluA-like domain-containing protein n=1 Tax=Cylicostephanus goldi TaxID=71465 RepID=A0A3P6R5S2_CYLGO|nr:unnamed protein product [Cylicostephanus goldi]
MKQGIIRIIIRSSSNYNHNSYHSSNKSFQKIACKLGRMYVNGKVMLDVDYILKNGDSIHHWGHRHEHPVRFCSLVLVTIMNHSSHSVRGVSCVHRYLCTRVICRSFDYRSLPPVSVLDLPMNVIAETDDLLVVDKPPSLPVHACGQYAVHTVLGQLRVNHNRTGLRGTVFRHCP